MKRFALILMVFAMLAISVAPALANSMEESYSSRNEKKEFDPEYYFCMIADLPLDESISFLKDYEIPVPRIFGKELDSAEDAAAFVKMTVDYYREHRFYGAYNLTWLHEFAKAIGDAAEEHFFNIKRADACEGTRGLSDSTVVFWNGDCAAYNCYAYALKRTDSIYNPGYTTSMANLTNYCVDHNVSDIGVLVIDDLHNSGYACASYYSSCPNTSSLLSGEVLICVRTASNYIDYHFMRYMPSTTKWNHKPGLTAVLKYKYSPASYNWTNEAFDGVNYLPGTIIYSGSIGYIIYKSSHSNTIIDLNDSYHRYLCSRCGVSHDSPHILNAAGTKCKICGHPAPFARNGN